MQTSLIITDNFYQNPDETREWALRQEFDVRGNFPGQRTLPVGWPDLRITIQDIIRSAAGEITKWDSEYTETFQYTTSQDTSWIHADPTMWAGVLYLTPDAPASGGTGLFRHKETGYICAPRLSNGAFNSEEMKNTNRDSRDFTKWDMTAMVGNVYNRLVLYRGDRFHTSLDYFGKDKYDGRLFQTFFFDTEY